MPDSADDIEDIIDSVAAGPSSASVDGRSATAQKLSDLRQIRDDRAASAAAGSSKFGLRFSQLVPPGCG